ncbi:hypothetical protein BGLA2_1470017 [Burkholderia gladioli]|nr:hypothetical protein BGLA2_1470017 [Burkholderia gladioli]
MALPARHGYIPSHIKLMTLP